MFASLIKNILKYFYRLFIFKVIVIDRNNFVTYDKLKTFCEYELISNLGPIRFIFKEDRRKRKRKLDNVLLLNSFLIELKVPDDIKLNREDLNDKVIIVIKLVLFKINYEILSEVLLDLYIDTIFTFIKSNPRTTSSTIE
jgi:hypothetical protein